jgi:hypothetical protein
MASTPDLFICFITFILTICSLDCTVANPMLLYLKSKYNYTVITLISFLFGFVADEKAMCFPTDKRADIRGPNANLEARAAVIATLFNGEGRGFWR